MYGIPQFAFLAPAILLGTAILRGQTIDNVTQEQIAQAVQSSIASDGAPSASIAIVVGDRVAYAKGFGSAVLFPVLPASAETRYQLASLSKTYTAQAVLLLVAAGKLSLDDSVSRWFPDITEASHVTVRQLLNHTSGYPDHYPQSYPAGPRGAAASPDRIIAEWGQHPLLFPPGTQFRYSNLEYEIAGRIVEKVSGKPLFQFMQERIFQPMGMTSTIDLDTIPADSTALATGYVRNALAPLQRAPYEGPGWSFGSGQVVTTAGDVARWDLAFLDHRVLPEREAVEEVTPARLAGGGSSPSALGLFVSHEDGVTHYYHTGQGLGFEAINLIYPDAHMAFVVLTNTSATSTYLKIANQLTYLLLPPTKDDAFARNVFAGLQSGQLDLSILSDDLRQYMDKGMRAAYRNSLAPLGPVQSFTRSRSLTVDGLKAIDYDVVAGGHPVKLHLLELPDGRLEDVSITDARNN
ncbi:MAG TPA: serine hydrolase domain-containing protein [Terracidiphilus sp.]|jgi:CubicO group peptidase (beta-lactamase class C family)|nr:serine hydrolase domain-containing protein [Terracidiphilus sp.]